MPEDTAERQSIHEPEWVTNMVRAEPRVPLMGPYMAYLLLMMFVTGLPEGAGYQHLGIVLHIGGATWATWLLRHHWPALGQSHFGLALIVGILGAWLWVAGQHGLSGVEIGGYALGDRLSLGLDAPFLRLVPIEVVDVSHRFATPWAFWTHVILKITRAITIVPIVEELFWRGFILRAFVNWNHFESVPIGRLTWFAFLGSSLLSVLQHPGNWGVSILCWMLFNALFYWKKSLRCLMITHGVTNLALYGYVVWTHLNGHGDWQFW